MRCLHPLFSKVPGKPMPKLTKERRQLFLRSTLRSLFGNNQKRTHVRKAGIHVHGRT